MAFFHGVDLFERVDLVLVSRADDNRLSRRIQQIIQPVGEEIQQQRYRPLHQHHYEQRSYGKQFFSRQGENEVEDKVRQKR